MDIGILRAMVGDTEQTLRASAVESPRREARFETTEKVSSRRA